MGQRMKIKKNGKSRGIKVKRKKRKKNGESASLHYRISDCPGWGEAVYRLDRRRICRPAGNIGGNAEASKERSMQR